MLRPLGDKIIVKLTDTEEVTKGGILLPSNAQEKSNIAEVIAIGPGGIIDGKEVIMNLKVGDKILCQKYLGTEVKYESNEYIILKQSDVLAIVE